MSMISDHLKAEIVDPTLPRDSFEPPSYDDPDDLVDGDVDDLVDDHVGDGEYDDE